MWLLLRPFSALLHIIGWPFYNAYLRLFEHFRVINRAATKNVTGPCIIVANHVGKYDPFFIGAALPFNLRWYPLSFVAKPSLMHVPIVGFIVWLLGAYSVPKGIGLAQSLKRPLAILKLGGNVFIFPEGKMKSEHGGRPRKPRRGVAYLAWQAPAAQILPVFQYRQPRYMTIVFGEPFRFADITNQAPKTLQELAILAERIMARVRELKSRC